jgi:hypothetical protein
MVYKRQTSDGDVFEFTEDAETLDGWSQHGSGQVHDDGFSLAATRALDRPEGFAFGRGNSENPDRAEGYLYFDAQNGTPAALSGKYEIVILNAADEVLATVDRGRLEEVRQGDPQQLGGTDTRGDYGVPFKYKRLRRGKGEVMGDDYKLGIRIELANGSGTDSFSVADSDLIAEGYSGRKVN